MKKNIIHILLGVLISGICLYFAFRGIDLEALGASFASVKYFYIIPVVLIVLVSHYLRCYRWGKILETLVRYDQKTLFILGSVGFMAVNILPARLGEFARPYLVKKRDGIRMSASMATIIVERVFDLLTVMLYMFIVLLNITLPGNIVKAGITILTISLSLLIVLIILAVKRDSSISRIDALLRVLPSKIAEPLSRLAHSFLDGLQILPDIGKTLYVFFLSVLLWGIVGLSAYVLFLGFGFDLSIINGFAITVIIAVGVMLPAAPGFIGTYHMACKIGLVSFGVSEENALSYAVLLHFFQMMPIIAIGLAMLPFQKLSLPGIIPTTSNSNTTEAG